MAVENSANAFRDHKSGKLKDRVAATHYVAHPHYYPTPVYQPSVYAPFQVQYTTAPVTPYIHTQALPAYQRYGAVDSQSAMMTPVYQYPRPPYQPSGVKRAMRPIPPVKISVPPVSAPPTRSRTRQSVCMQFLTRGYCNYGVTCRYSHEAQAHQAVPHSSPARSGEHSSPRPRFQHTDSPKSAPPSNQSMLELDFPSLSIDTRNDDKIPSTHEQDASRTPKALGFRDAVLNQKASLHRSPTSPRKSLTNSDGGWSDHSDPDPGNPSNNQVLSADETKETVRKTEPSQARTHIESPARPAVDVSSQHVDIQRRRRSSSYHTRVRTIMPELGERAYPVRSVYVHPQTVEADDSSSFMSLSREAFRFVQDVDTKLRTMLVDQHNAIQCLEDVAVRLWADSEINVYGSNYTRLALPVSDVDCVINVPSQAGEQPAEVLSKIAHEVRQHISVTRVELLDAAKIPVLKVVFGPSSEASEQVMLDLTCAHSPGHSGLNARDLIYSFQVEMPALRPLVLVLKSHLQRHGLNCPFTGGLSSYGLVLMAIRFLQACGDEHSFVHVGNREGDQAVARRSFDSTHSSYPQKLWFRKTAEMPPTYEFSRNGQLTWRTRIGNLLLLFLETYITFDYRQFGIRVDGAGEYFPIPHDKITLHPGPVVSPYIVDPIRPSRTIGNSFRMHEIVQAWYTLYQQITTGAALEDALSAQAHVVMTA